MKMLMIKNVSSKDEQRDVPININIICSINTIQTLILYFMFMI